MLTIILSNDKKCPVTVKEKCYCSSLPCNHCFSFTTNPDGNNPATEIGDQALVPSFTIVQHREARVVLLLDTSGSMKVLFAAK